MKKYDKIVRAGHAGIYAAPGVLGPLREAAKRAGMAWCDLDLAGAGDRGEFLTRCAEVFALPAHFGRNWDALRDSLIDFAAQQRPGTVVHWRRGAELARRSPESMVTALEIFQEAAMYGAGAGGCFVVIVDRDGAPGVDLAPLR